MVDTVRTLADALSKLPINSTRQISPQDVRDALLSSLGIYGWGAYIDGTYTEGAPLLLVAATPTFCDNDKGTVYEQELPADIPTFVDETGKILCGRAGDMLSITFSATFKPTTANATELVMSFDPSGVVPHATLYARTFYLDRGLNVPHKYTFTVSVFCLEDWAVNGAEIFLEANHAVSVYDVALVVERVHRGRGTY